MPYAVTIVPVSPLRKLAAHTSEMISQSLFGDCLEVLHEADNGWVKIRHQYDGYEGFITASHIEPVPLDYYEAAPTHFTAGWSNTVTVNDLPMHLPFGCVLKTEEAVTWGLTSIRFNAALTLLPKHHPGSEPFRQQLLAFAHAYLNTAYLWGGRTVFGVDCSGFTQSVYRVLGIPLLRDAYQQATQGQVLDFLQEARPGDLAFFDNAEGRITHVGILLNDHEILHASGKVRIDAIDTQGIINAETGVRTHQLRIIKRLF
ncbi:hydrolase Nlp/P60 [Chitinophaga parva]|uniref:Hydrolase Nlp/P60 n=1 Tax=Chitinophaga parva TaxID=2169414 RepID=A0A2T7BI68_9BACT|nr:C40 family peptidase [Chitinophaga parva]PUZ25980.1 hydrolase Nlp/P60 [Chitinophaga parva]